MTKDREVLLGLSQSLDPKGQGGKYGCQKLPRGSRREGVSAALGREVTLAEGHRSPR